MNRYTLAADALLVIHTSFVIFVVVGLLLIVVGGLRGWQWVFNPWFRVLHLAAIAVVVIQAWAGRICPLTTWEMALRRRGGQATYDDSFIAYWLGRLLYYDAAPWVFVVLYSGFGLLVLASWWWLRPRSFRRQASGR